MNGQETWSEGSVNQNKENDQIMIVKDYIYSLLSENKIRIGDRLPSEKALSEQLDVTKSAVRDALQSLKTVGLLSSVRGSGYRLRPDFDYSLADILHAMVVYSSSSRRDIREVREALELKELELIIGAGLPDDIHRKLSDTMEIITSYLGREVRTEHEAEELVQADMEFHRMLAQGSGNMFIRAFNIALNEYHEGNRKAIPETVRQRVSDELLKTHRRILESIQEADLNKGVLAIREHYAIGDRVTETKEGDPVLQSAIFELQKKGFSRQQIMEKLLELQ